MVELTQGTPQCKGNPAEVLQDDRYSETASAPLAPVDCQQ